MPFYFTPYIILPLLSALLNGAIAVYAYRRRYTPSATWFLWLEIGISGWALSYSLNTASTTLTLKHLFWKTGSIFLNITLCTLFPLFLTVMGRKKPFSRPMLALMWFMPIIATVLLLTNDLHGLIRHSMHLVSIKDMLLMGFQNGSYQKAVQMPYIYLYFLTVILLSIIGALNPKQANRGSLIMIALASSIPLAVEAIKITPEWSFTTSATLISGICYWRAVFQHQMLNLVPVAGTTLFNQMPEPVIIFDINGRISECNKAALDNKLLSPTMFGKPLDREFPAGDPMYEKLLVLTSGKDDLFYDSDHDKWWRPSKTPLYKGSSAVGQIMVLHDVSSLKQAQEKLRLSEERFRRLTEESPDIVWEIDNNFCITYVNKADQLMRGFPQDEVLGQPVTRFLTEEGRELISSKHAERMKDESQGLITGAARYEMQMLSKEGRLYWTETRSNPLRNAHGIITGFIGVTRDITDRKDEEKRLQQLLVYEKELRLELGSFLSMISHEYRTPLSIIRTNLDLIDLIFSDSKSECSPKIAAMRVGINRLVELLDVSMNQLKASMSSHDITTKQIPLVPFIDEVLDESESFWPERVFLFLPRTNSVNVLADKPQLKIVMLNLLENACKYSPPRTEIIVELEADANIATISVFDKGEDFPKNTSNNIFNIFERGDNSIYTTGSGIGLWLSKRIITRHGGEFIIDIGNEIKTKISFKLPVA